MQLMSIETYHATKDIVVESLKTGIFQFDFQNGIGVDDFTVIAGGTGSGKSTLSLFMACNIAKNDKKVLYFNTENTMQVMAKKISFFGFDFDNDFGTKNQKGNPERLVIWNTKELSYDQVHNAVLTIKPDVLFLDLFSSLTEKFIQWEMINKTRDYAKEFSYYPEKYNCAVIATEQLLKENRSKRPTENDISGGKGLSNKATKIITIYRHINENMDKLMTMQNSENSIAHFVSELIVRKDRHGRLKNRIYPVKLEYGGYKDLLEFEKNEYSAFLKGIK